MLKIGDKAPLFESKDQDGNRIRLEDFLDKGKKIVLYFYPKDDTSGCTAQACNLRDNYNELLNTGYTILGISIDSEKSHQKFISKYSLPFPLIADTEKQIVQLYGVWQEKKMYGKAYMGTMRTTFVIDSNGVIEKIISKVDTKNHTEQILTP